MLHPLTFWAVVRSAELAAHTVFTLRDRAIAAEAALGRAVVAGAVPTGTPPVPISVPTAPEWIDRPEAARRLGVHVQTLDALINGTPRTLPGAPTIVGHGGKRRHYRFHADSLAEWAAAARDYRARTGRRGAPRVRPDRDKS